MAVTSALLFTVVLGIAALAVDLGSVFVARRKAQSAADLAAMAAVSDMPHADKAASNTIARNRVSPDDSYALQFGVYTPDPTIAPANRFVPSSSVNANAARVTVHTKSSLFLAKPISGKSELAITTSATAARTAFASFAIGSRLLKIDGGLLNQILGGALGSSLSLSVMDYQALVDAKIDLFDFSNSLATRLRMTGVTYDSVLNANVKVSDIFAAMIDTEKNQYGPASPAVAALSAIGQSVQGATTKLNLGSAIDLGPYTTMPVGQKPKNTVTASVFDVVSATAQIANGQHQIQATLNVNLPGIAGASLQIAIGERPQHTSWITVGAEGASVYTAQTRILLTVQISGASPIGTVSLPIYVAIASGTAKLTSLQCGFPNVGTSTVTLGVTPGVVDAWIGDVSNSQFSNFSSAPNPPAATLVNVSGLKVTGRAHATISNMSATPVNFYYSDIQQQTKKTVSTRDFSSSLLASLIGDTQLGVSVAGLGLGLGGISSAVGGLLSSATPSIDQLLSSVFQTLGIGLGQADVWVLDLRCDGAVLVN